jgi:hypothetical protein
MRQYSTKDIEDSEIYIQDNQAHQEPNDLSSKDQEVITVLRIININKTELHISVV